MRLAILAALFLATPAMAEEIVPLDGTWTVRSVEAAMGETCPAALAPMAEQAQANVGRRDLYDVSWRGAFNPNHASGLDPDNQGIVWVEDGPGAWRANLAGADKDYVIARMEVESETRIRNSVRMDVAQLMATEGGAIPGVEGCTLTMRFLMELKR